MIQNLRRVRQKWVWFPQVIGREGADARASGMFYTGAIQVVLLYRSESWFMYPKIVNTLGGFHHRVIRQLTGHMPQRNGDGTWT